MKRVLYIESGTTGGGTFASMLLNLACIDAQRYMPYAVFLNETPHKKQTEELGVTTYLLRHPIYARRGGFQRRLYRYFLRTSARHLPALYLVIGNETGLLVSPDDPRELCSALQAFSDDTALRRRLVSSAHASTRFRFHIRKCVAAIGNIYAAAGVEFYAGARAGKAVCQPA